MNRQQQHSESSTKNNNKQFSDHVKKCTKHLNLCKGLCAEQQQHVNFNNKQQELSDRTARTTLSERTMKSWSSFSSRRNAVNERCACGGKSIDSTNKNNYGTCGICDDYVCGDCVVCLCDYCNKLACSDCIERRENCITHANICTICSSSETNIQKDPSLRRQFSSRRRLQLQLEGSWDQHIMDDCKNDIQFLKNEIKSQKSAREELEISLAKAELRQKQTAFFMSYFPSTSSAKIAPS